MTRPVIHLILPAIAAFLIIAAILFILQASQRRTRSNREAYNVGRQEARMAMQRNLLLAVTALVVGLILVGVYLLLPSATEAESAAEPTLEPTTDVVEVEETAVSPPHNPIPESTDTPTELPPVVVSTLTPIPTSPPAPTATPEPEPTATLAPTEVVVETAVVTSGVGVWLRSSPSVDGEQLEWLLTETEVIVLEGQTTADEFDWQEVQAASGNVGWVAVPFIELATP